MSRLTLAKQGFQTLAPLLLEQSDESVGNLAESWLRDEVCPVVSELVEHPKFREATLWTVNHLSQNQKKPEWLLLQTVENRLVRFARDLLTTAETYADEFAPDDLEQLKFVADRPWVEMASPLDFFHPSLSLFLKGTDPEGSHHNAFRERELRGRLGDYVMLCMFSRIDHWRGILLRIEVRVSTLIPGGADGSKEFKAVTKLFNDKIELDRALKELYKRCQIESEVQLRDACTALVQVYTCYSISPKLDWIPAPRGMVKTSKSLIRSTIRRPTNVEFCERQNDGTLKRLEQREVSLCDPSVLRQVAAALETVTALFDSPNNPEEMIEWARREAQLVVVDSQFPEVYWEGDHVPVPWDSFPVEWNLFCVLAENRGRYINQSRLDNPGEHKIASRRSRLKQRLVDCPELDCRIKNKKGVGYCLDLDKSKVIYLQEDGPDRLRIVS